MTDASFRFYEELNDFLPPARRKKEFQAPLADQATVKQAIEALGVPHTEVELILVDGRSVDFAHRLRGGERVAVYPKFETLDITPLRRVRPAPMREPRFVADAHLGGLARLLRLAGFDTLFENDYADDVLVSLAIDQGRIILSRDRELLKRREITHGCYVRALKPPLQFCEIAERLALRSRMRPFSRCLVCNGSLQPIRKAAVIDRLPPAVALHHETFAGCDGCGRIYWAGSHWRRMQAIITSLAHPSVSST
jgi:uncharacterized protein with PIN domain